jgi:2-polyprenyl-3-methyl-5-hydroxy-6-metoxy-1,4-benzoquinol methylase
MKQKCRICDRLNPIKLVNNRYVELNCRDCGSTSFYFSEKYQYGEDYKYSDISYLNNYELRWAHEIILDYFNGINNKSNIKCLEIGCFNGQFVNELRLLGIDSFGTDVNERAIAFGVNKYFPDKPHILSTATSELLLNANTIVLIDVLEHMENPLEFLRSLPANVSKVIISSPLANKFFFDKSDFPPHHYTRINPIGLFDELSKLGFSSKEELFIQSSGLLLFRNLVGRIKYGWGKKWYQGSPVFSVKSGVLRKVYLILDKATSYLFKIFGLKYSAFVLIVKK